MKGVISLKKRIIPLILLLAMLLSLSAYAASPRVMTILPAISFDGTTANCRVSVSADRSTDGPVKIYAQNCLQAPAE